MNRIVGFWSKQLVLLTLCCLQLGGITHAGTEKVTMKIVSEAWDKYANEEGAGLFLDITREIFEPAGVELQIQFMPYKRALSQLETKVADAMYGTYSEAVEGKDYIITPTLPIDREITVVIYKTGKIKNWRGVQSLKNRELAWVRGYDYGDVLTVPVKLLTEVRNSEQGLNMLQAGRFDYFLDHSIELYDTINKIGFDISGYQVHAVIENDIFMAFAKTEKGRYLSGVFDKGMARLMQSNKLKPIFERYQIPYPFDH